MHSMLLAGRSVARCGVLRSNGLERLSSASALATRWSTRTPITSGDARKGMVIYLDGRYLEVNDWWQTGQGRQTRGHQINYEECDTGKTGTVKLPTKLTRVECDREELEVMYVDSDAKKVVLADENYNEVELDVSRFLTGTPTDGQKVLLWKDDDTIVKVHVRTG
mmetsp:Transcript_33035/g.60579  ORF Transcript_33035/g.60579 Transcript_33035/m.60579 type:complete len:165 (+) Transcript_33035:80-574(+)